MSQTDKKYYCPVCESRSIFLPYGVNQRPAAKCPKCASLERHRLSGLFFKKHTEIFKPPLKKVLHIAPEPMLSRQFSDCNYIEYLSADIQNQAMVQMDITDIQYPDGSFDVIYCSHVLEYVSDDLKAMGEFMRVLKPGGWAVIQAVINAEQTIQRKSYPEGAEQENLFGNAGHQRKFGPDIVNRFKSAGFKVKVITGLGLCSKSELDRMRIKPSQNLYYCN
jgi:SAM-dependent methyltransferase